jgi:hypothetical protein
MSLQHLRLDRQRPDPEEVRFQTVAHDSPLGATISASLANATAAAGSDPDTTDARPPQALKMRPPLVERASKAAKPIRSVQARSYAQFTAHAFPSWCANRRSAPSDTCCTRAQIRRSAMHEAPSESGNSRPQLSAGSGIVVAISGGGRDGRFDVLADRRTAFTGGGAWWVPIFHSMERGGGSTSRMDDALSAGREGMSGGPSGVLRVVSVSSSFDGRLGA